MYSVILFMSGCLLYPILKKMFIEKCEECTYSITFFQFAFFSIIQFIILFSKGLLKPKIPVKEYFRNMILFFMFQVLNNRALSYGVSIQLQSTIKASGLLLIIVFGKLFFNRQYGKHKYVGVIVITLGLLISVFYDKSFQMKTCSMAYSFVQQQW